MPFEQGPVTNFIGQGLTFPIQLENGQGKIFSGFDLIRSSIRMILAWPMFERFLLGEFGSRVEDVLEESNDDILQNLVFSFITDAISSWEKRVELLGVEVERNENDPLNASLQISLTYRIVNSQLIDNFVFPFYRKIIY